MLAPVLREAVTNVLRHSAAKSCTIEVTATGDTLRLGSATTAYRTGRPPRGLRTGLVMEEPQLRPAPEGPQACRSAVRKAAAAWLT